MSKPYPNWLLAGLLEVAACSGETNPPPDAAPRTLDAVTPQGDVRTPAQDGPPDAAPQVLDAATSDVVAPDAAAPDVMAPDTAAPDAVAPDVMALDAVSSDAASSDVATPRVNLFVNPSLETWTSARAPNTTPDEWTNCSMGSLAVDAVPDSCMAMPNTAADGARYARAYQGEGIQQTIPTARGATYVITFQYTAVGRCFGGTPDSSWDVLIDGTGILSLPGDAAQMWRAATVTFVATADATTICFRKPVVGGQGGIDLLDVRLQ